jgi:transposase
LKKPYPVGIDVSAKELVLTSDRSRDARFDNDPAGHKKLVRFLTKGGRAARVVLEATGVYSLDLALALHRAPRIEVMVANPRAVANFAKAYLQRSKTDPLDAEVLLEFARRMPFTPWVPPAPEHLDLRALSRRIAALTKTSQQEKNRLHAASQCSEVTPLVRRDIEVNIRHLERRIEHLRHQALALIEEHAPLQEAFEHLVSIKGIADASAISILGELATLPADMTVRQWVAHAGLDPRHVQSGSSIHKPARISKAGNKYLRAALYMPALVAIQHEPNVAAFYDKLVARGKTKMQANIAVMRKLLHAIFGMLKNRANFDGEKFYATNT